MKKKRRKHITPEEIQQLRELWEYETTTNIAKMLKRSRTGILQLVRRLRKEGIDMPRKFYGFNLKSVSPKKGKQIQ
jgi:transposase